MNKIKEIWENYFNKNMSEIKENVDDLNIAELKEKHSNKISCDNCRYSAVLSETPELLCYNGISTIAKTICPKYKPDTYATCVIKDSYNGYIFDYEETALSILKADIFEDVTKTYTAEILNTYLSSINLLRFLE